MKMTRCMPNLKCDFYGCKNNAKYAFSTKGFLRKELVFCDDCMKGMFECFSKNLVPKGVESAFKNRRRKENL